MSLGRADKPVVWSETVPSIVSLQAWHRPGGCISVCFSRDVLFVVLERDLSWLLCALVGSVRQD